MPDPCGIAFDALANRLDMTSGFLARPGGVVNGA
jgi:hypothetical protein